MKVNGVDVRSEYTGVLEVFLDALDQAQRGEMQAGAGQDFEAQPLCEIARRLSSDFCLGEAVHKVYDARVLRRSRGAQAAVDELLGAIHCLAAGVIVLREEHFEELSAESGAGAGRSEGVQGRGGAENRRSAHLPWVLADTEKSRKGEKDD
ncbi:MAG: hypothetical protein ACP5SH_27090 [Syntrophobacteraceae bacterium]